MDRAFTVPAPPADVMPWLVQLGKGRAGWYLPSSVESLLPRSRRALRHLDPRWQSARVGDVIPDYGGRDATFTVEGYDPPRSLVYASRRGHTAVSWSMTLTEVGAASRVHLRLRLAPVRHRRLAETLGGALDLVTVAGMAAGLRERLT